MAKESMFSKVLSRLSGKKQKPAAESSMPEKSTLKLVFFITDWNNANALMNILLEEHIHFHFITKGRGTANNEILNLLGIGASDKALVFSMEQAALVPVLLKKVRKKIGFYNPGAGIAFTIPLSAINDPLLFLFSQSIHKNAGSEGENMASDFSHDLIVAVVNQGYSEELMVTAREAGASGGTIINARGQAHGGAVKFFGISVQDEKEILLILTSREKKVAIMQAVCEAHGLNSKAHGVVFSMPVDNVMGLASE